MNNKCLQLSTTIGIMLLICAFAAAQGEPIQVLYPVSGRLAYAVATELRVIDTETAEVTAGDTTIDEALVAYERWSGDGSKISYLATGNIQILDWQTRQVIGTYPYRTNGSFFPEGGWNGSGTQILGVTGDLDWDYDEVQIFDLASGARTTVLRYYDDMPIPQIPDRLFFSIIDLDWNPVYDDWIVICIDTSPLGSENDPELFGEYRGLLYNISTGQSFILDELFSEPLNLASRIRWSSDGNYLLVGTGQFNVEGHYHIVRFQPEVAGQPLKVVQTAPAILRHGILDWVGMGDLFILQTYDTDQTLLLLIAQIIDGELHTTGFLRIPVTTAHMSRGDWVLDAGPEERAALSCLFDQTLEARLAVGMGGQVAFTDGTPSRLRDAPGLAGQEVTLMPEGTPFTVTGGPVCADGYRWWQIALDDNTTGWAAEANTEIYFLEPWAPPARAVLFSTVQSGNRDIYAMRPDGSDVQRVLAHAGEEWMPEWSPDGTRISFVADWSGNWDIYTMAADGSDIRQLTSTAAWDDYPDWSPDGTQLVFESDRDGDFDLYVMNADGGNVRQLTHNTALDRYAVWSPDGGRIAFVSKRDGGQEIYTMNPDGSDQRRLTIDEANDSYPAWTPDGAQIVFFTDRADGIDLYLMNRDGTNVRPLITDNGNYWPENPVSFAPDGSQFVYASRRVGRDYEIWRANADGSGLVALTANSVHDHDPSWWSAGPPPPPPPPLPEQVIGFVRQGELYTMSADGSTERRLTAHWGSEWMPEWSPDGTRLNFVANWSGNWDIYTMAADGSDIRQLTSTAAWDDYPNWSPDGTQLVFESNRDGDFDLYVMNADGGNVRQVINHPARDRFAAWSPDGGRIAFVSDRDGNQELYVVNVDGTGLQRLTSHPAADRYPAWVPDGSGIIFFSDRDGPANVYRLNANLADVQLLIGNNGSFPENPVSWSPDGSQLIFASSRDGGDFEIWRADADGSGLVALTANTVDDHDPDWK